MTAKIKLVTSKFSPYSHRVEMVLIEKNISYEKEVIDLQHRPEQFVKDSPLGKVPLLYADGKILFESIVICEYLEEAFPETPLILKICKTRLGTALGWNSATEFSPELLA